MTVALHALPYDISAPGFYFENVEDYGVLAAKAVNAYGDPVEEFEIQFIDGDLLDATLAKAFGLNQCNIGHFFEAVDDWREDQKIRFIIAVGECGHSFDCASDDVDDLDVDIYEVGSMRELAEQFADEGLLGEIPEHLAAYIDYDAFARDLAVDYSEALIAGRNFIYRMS
jgi:antirestriction protein